MQYSYGFPFIFKTAENLIIFYIPDILFCKLYTNQYTQGQFYCLPGCLFSGTSYLLIPDGC